MKTIHINDFREEINKTILFDEWENIEDKSLFQNNIKAVINKIQTSKNDVSVQEFANLLKKQDWCCDYEVQTQETKPWNDGERVVEITCDFTAEAHKEIDYIFHEDYVKDVCGETPEKAILIF